ncbi:hypothetical protein ASPCADRAFT_132418, partial [Aspergillus carbonarius ITEM 5010]
MPSHPCRFQASISSRLYILVSPCTDCFNATHLPPSGESNTDKTMAVCYEDIPPPLPPRPITIYTPPPLPKRPQRETHTDTKPLTTTITTIPSPTSTTPTLIHNQITTTFPRPSTILPKPIVIPQTAHTYHGTIHRPFTRAYSPTLTPLITPLDFLTFLDALNTVWLANPYIQAAGQAGNLLSFVPTIEFQLIALGIQTAAEYGSFVVSHIRTREYLRLANERLFNPRGLRVRVLGTEEMCRVLGKEGGELVLPRAFDDGDRDRDGGFDPRMRRMEALKDYVSPLVYEEKKRSGEAGGDNWLRRAAGMQEKWFAERQNNVLIGRQGKAVRGIGEAEVAERELLGK